MTSKTIKRTKKIAKDCVKPLNQKKQKNKNIKNLRMMF